MKLIAEIADAEGNPVQVACEGETLSVGAVRVPLAEFRKALDAVAPRPQPVQAGPILPVTSVGIGINPYSPGLVAAPEPTRNPDGSRRGESPRYGMRARPAPEANVVEPEQETAA